MRNCQIEESTLDFVEELWRLSKKFNFSVFLDNMLIDKLVGINDNRIQRRLFAQKDNDVSRSL